MKKIRLLFLAFFLLIAALVYVCVINVKHANDRDTEAVEIYSVSEEVSDSSVVEQEEGLAFKGVVIDGTLDNFIRKLKMKGFAVKGKKEHEAVMKGTFAGEPVTIIATATPSNYRVYAVTVISEDVDTWQKALKMYDRYKNLYTTKYGSPTSTTEYYKGWAGPNEHSSMNHSELEKGNVKFVTNYKIDKGNISISIQPAKYGDFCIQIVYLNDKNVAANDDEILKEI